MKNYWELTPQELKSKYDRGLEILRRVSDADDQSINTIMLRHIWTPQDLENLSTFIRELQDIGIHLVKGGEYD